MHRPEISGPVVYNLEASATPHLTTSFGITVNFVAAGNMCDGSVAIDPTAAEIAAFNDAEAKWESTITGYQDTLGGDDSVTITACMAAIDGPNGTLGSAGPTGIKTGFESNFLYASTGEMIFDSADSAALVMAGTFDDVVLHEMGHVLGIGTLWNEAGFQDLYDDGSGEYTGAAGLAAYQTEFDQPAATFVPVELGGGPGTVDGHWKENLGGAGATGIVSNITGLDLQFELMTGWLNPPTTFLSTLTRDSMIDLGYTVIPEPSVAIYMGIFGLVGLSRRPRR